MLESFIRERRRHEPILLMAHIVLGYPSLAVCKDVVAQMLSAGVDLIELQIPFSEPLADGPVIAHANQAALAAGTRLEDCFLFAQEVAQSTQVPILFMSYYNLLYKFDTSNFMARCAQVGVRGTIVPDLPHEEADEYLRAARTNGLDPIFLFSPQTSDLRLKLIAQHAAGFVYCVARTGITGSATAFSDDLDRYLQRCRNSTRLPLAVGFGVKQRPDVDFLRNKADIAVVGSETLRVIERAGPSAVGPYLRSLRP